MQASSGQQSKAAYLLDLTRYVNWPGIFPSAGDPINLRVLADEVMGEMVRSTVEERRSRGRPIRLIRRDSPTLAGDCHIVFLAAPPGVRFLVDAGAAQRTGLRIGSRMLALALQPDRAPEEQR